MHANGNVVGAGCTRTFAAAFGGLGVPTIEEGRVVVLAIRHAAQADWEPFVE
jgi:hypothetical protein